MVFSTVPSAYGPLTINKDKDSFKSKLPNLQFDSSDLVIKLGRKSEDWLLVHAEVLRKTCSLLAPGISEDWDNTSSAPEVVIHPDTGARVPLRTKALKFVDGTYVLEGKEVLENYAEDTSVDLFPASSLAPPGWHDIDVYPHDTLNVTRRAMVVLVALLYGAHLDCHFISGLNQGRPLSTITMDHIVQSVVITVCAIAEFWGCLDVIKPRILSVLKSSMVYWEIVAGSPEKHMALAMKLEDAEIYRDALRHMIAEANFSDEWEEISNIMDWSETELRHFYKPQFEALRTKVSELREDLQTLQLVYLRAKHWGGRWHDAPMRYIDTIPQNEERKRPSRVHWLAGSIFSEYLTSQISGERFIENDHRVEKAGNLSLAIHKIAQAAKTPYPASLFDSATSIYIAADFNLSFLETRQLEQHLHLLVHKASLRIEAAFPADEGWERIPHSRINTNIESNFDADADWADHSTEENSKVWQEDCIHFSLDRAHYDAHRHGYTYLKIPTALPWSTKDQAAVPPPGNVGLVAGISVADATPGWIQALEKHYTAFE